MVSNAPRETGRSFAQPGHSRQWEDKAHQVIELWRLCFGLWIMDREWTALTAFLASLHLSKAGGWSPARFVSARWWSSQLNDLQVVICRRGVPSLRGCLPIISQGGKPEKPKHSKTKKSEAFFCITTNKSHSFLPCIPPHWLLKHTYGGIGRTWRMN